MLQHAPSLADQVYDAIVEEICDGRLAPGDHLVQERLAKRFGVSRQPIQQTMNRLRADGMVEEIGKRGLFVARLDPEAMQHHYGVRAALDGWAARRAAERVAESPDLCASVTQRSQDIFSAAEAAQVGGEIATLISLDDAFHSLIYETSGNPMIADAAAPHWRFLRRAMGDVLRKVHTPSVIWGEHREIIGLILVGDAVGAARKADEHAASAAWLLAETLASSAENAA